MTVVVRSVSVSGLLRVITNVSSLSTIVSSLTVIGKHFGLSLLDVKVRSTEIGAKSRPASKKGIIVSSNSFTTVKIVLVA